MKFSIVVVTLNAGDDLIRTINSIKNQNFTNYEIIIKDGDSSDNSISLLTKDDQIRIFIEKDTGIYDAMNQALNHVTGDLVLFLNSGDTFYNETVLSDIKDFITEAGKKHDTIFYGDCYTVNRNAYVRYPDVFDDYTCFTKTLCHQATVYPSNLFSKRKFNTEYTVGADFEYYVYAYTRGITLVHMPIVVANYLGGGASEAYKNRNKSCEESTIILRECFGEARYKAVNRKALLKFTWIKKALVKSRLLYKPYSWLAGFIYRALEKSTKGNMR